MRQTMQVAKLTNKNEENIKSMMFNNFTFNNLKHT